MTEVRMESVVAADLMVGEDDEDTRLLQTMLGDATRYLEGFAWCKRIRAQYFGLGVGGVVAVFLFQIEPTDDVDAWLWVVCGDLPSAYLVTDDAPDPNAALTGYCELMEDWIRAVKGGASLDDVFPVPVEPTDENARALEKRLEFIRTEILSDLP